MVHVFRLGPIDIGGRPSWCIGGVDGEGDLIRPEFGHSDKQALAAVAKRHAGEPLRCEPALADVARPLGFEPAPIPQGALVARAVLAYGIANGPSAGKPGLVAFLRFVNACAAFWAARPWELFGSDEALPVQLATGGRWQDRELSILGAGGQEFGVGLYDNPGSIDLVSGAMALGQTNAVRQVNALSATFDEEPGWAASAFADAFGLPRLPVALRVKKGRASVISTVELLQLAAVLEAAVELASDDTPDDSDQVEVTVEAAGLEVIAHVGYPAEFDDQLDEDLAEPMLVPEPLPVQRREKTPRNAPCPCGSGRKYKKCHLAEDEAREAAARGQGPEAEEARAHQRRLAERDPIHALDERITADALALARRRWGRAFDPEGALRSVGVDFQVSQAILGWSSGHFLGPVGRTALDLYVEERGGGLDDLGRRLVDAQRGGWFSLQEVVAVEPGRSLLLRDLLAGGERTVEEKSGSRTLDARDVILARILDLGDRCILAGCHPQPLKPRDADAARQVVRKALGARGAKVSVAKLRQATADGTILGTWQVVVDEAARRPPPQLQNTDGEDFILTVDRFDIAEGGSGAALAALLDLPGASRDEDEADDGGEAAVSFVRRGNARGVLPTTLVGRAIVAGQTLRLETNSVERADRLRDLVRKRLGPQVAFRIREHADPLAQLDGKEAHVAAGPPEPMPPEVLEAVRKMQAEYYQRWLDEPVPALGGLTPRVAAKRKGAPRKKLDLLLAEFENSEARAPAAQRFDFAQLRRALGLLDG